MPKYCIYCKTVYEDDVKKCINPECNGTDFRYISQKQFEDYNGKKVKKE